MTYRDEYELLTRLLEKDEHALRNFVMQYSPGVQRFIGRQIKDRQEVEELVQDVFMDFIEGVRSFRGESSIKTYLISIARNKVVDYIRKKKLKMLAFSAFPPYVVEGFQKVFLDDELDKKELQQRIHNTLTQLPNDYQIILRLKYMENRKMKEIADILSMKFKAAESLLMRARRAFAAAYVKI